MAACENRRSGSALRSASRNGSRPPCCFPHGGPRCRRRLARRRHRGGFAPTAKLPGTSTARLKRAPIEALLTSNSSHQRPLRSVRETPRSALVFPKLHGRTCRIPSRLNASSEIAELADASCPDAPGSCGRTRRGSWGRSDFVPTVGGER